MQQFYQKLTLDLSENFKRNEIELILGLVESGLSDYEVKRKATSLILPDKNFISEFFVAKYSEGMSKKSMGVYSTKLKNFMRIVNKPLQTVTTSDIRKCLVVMKEINGNSERTMEHTRQVINSFYKWMWEQKYIDENPCATIKKVKYQPNPRKPLSQKELEMIRYACRNDLKKTALIEFLYSTGCRGGELEHIKMSDVNFEKKEVAVVGKGNKHRTVYLNDRAENALKRYIETKKDTPYLFDRRSGSGGITIAGVEYILDQIGKEAGLDRKLKPHDIRHTMATHSLSRGMPIEELQVILGHSNIDTTLIYAKVDRENVKQDHKKYLS